jgi:transposase
MPNKAFISLTLYNICSNIDVKRWLMGTIISRKQGKNTYYFYHETFRQKISPSDSGKTRGSGKSKVCSRSIYLGTAEKILSSVQEKRTPMSVNIRHFGLIAAAYQTAHEIGLPQVLETHIRGNQDGTPRWLYFFVTVLNRLDHATSKNKMWAWLKKTILPDLLGVSPRKFSSKNFWYATDEVISEKALRLRRFREGDEDDMLVGFEESLFTSIEAELFSRVDQVMGLSPSVICYDTTNFYTYLEEPTRSELARTCHSKDSKHYLKHVGLLMAVEQSHGIPLMSRVYRANGHDSKVFSFMLADLILTLKQLCGPDSDLVLILDKGNNSPENFTSMSGHIGWIGALVPSQHEDLLALEQSDYHGKWQQMYYYRCRKPVMEMECVLVLTFNPALKRKQEHTLTRGIEKLKQEICQKWDGYKKTPTQIPPGMRTLQKKSAYGRCLHVSVCDGKPYFTENAPEIGRRKKRFGKNLIFSNMMGAETGYLIDTYHAKQIIEDDFHLLKDPMLIRFRPIRHWTDSKIRAYAFCCIMSMLLMRVMQWKTEQAGYPMSPAVLKDELTDLQEVVMVYSPSVAERRITERSAVQHKLWKIFHLEEIQQKISLH